MTSPGWKRASVPIAVLLLACAAGPAAAEGPAAPEPISTNGQIVDRVVAILDGKEGKEVIALSDLRFEAAVALIQRNGLRAATEELDDAALAQALEYAISQRLQTRDADRLGAFPIDEADVEVEVKRFERQFPDPAGLARFLARHEADRLQLTAVIARSMRAVKILDSKVRLRAQVAEADVERYYAAHAAELGAPLEQSRERIRELLYRERYRQLATAELAQLQRTADVRRIAPFAARGPAQPGALPPGGAP